MFAIIQTPQPAQALTNPQYFVMRGRVIDKDLRPRHGFFDMRVSLWTDADANAFDPQDVSKAFWTEVHSVDTGSGGNFEIRVGTQNALPVPFNFDTYQYLQLDARPALELDYTILDPQPENPIVDRIHLVTLPFRGDNSGSANVPTLNEDGEISESVLPGSVKTLLSSLEERMETVEAKIEDSSWKHPVATSEDLDLENAQVGEVRYVVSDQDLRVFNGDSWNSVQSASSATAPAPVPTQGSYSYRSLLLVHKQGTGTPGLFYWDSTNKEYYVGMKDGSLRSLFGDHELPGRFQDNSWVDLRYARLKDLKIERTSGVTFHQDSLHGLRIKTSGKKRWDYGLSFPRGLFNPREHSTFEFVVYTGNMKGHMMFGLADESFELQNQKTQTFQGVRTGLFLKGENIDNKLFGHSEDGSEWYDLYQRTEPWRAETFYRVKIRPTKDRSSQQWLIDEVDADDWDQSIRTLVDFTSDYSLGTDGLKPFWALQGSSDYFLSGFRTY